MLGIATIAVLASGAVWGMFRFIPGGQDVDGWIALSFVLAPLLALSLLRLTVGALAVSGVWTFPGYLLFVAFPALALRRAADWPWRRALGAGLAVLAIYVVVEGALYLLLT